MATSIKFNEYSLTTGNIRVRRIGHEQANLNLTLEELARREKGKLVAELFANKEIAIEGLILGDDQPTLEDNIDNFKKHIAGVGECNLDIEYGGDTRRYFAVMESVVVSRDFFHKNFAPYQMVFKLSDPAGYEPAIRCHTHAGITSSPYSFHFTAVGSMFPEPVFTLTINEAYGLERFRIKNISTGDQINVSDDSPYTAGEVYIVSNADYFVSENGTELDYDGVFPKAGLDDKWELSWSATRVDADLQICYRARYS